MRLSGQFQSCLFICLFFYEKFLNIQKRKSNQNQLTKQKQTNKKHQRRQVFMCTKTSTMVKVVCFAFWCFFTQIVLTASFYNTTNKNFIFSCIRCSCTILILTSYYLYTKVTLILVLLMLNIYIIIECFFKLWKRFHHHEKIPVLTTTSHDPALKCISHAVYQS